MKAVVVKHGFGELKPGIERVIGECRFSLVFDGREVVYTRLCGDNVFEAIVKDVELRVVPGAPIYAEPRLSSIVLAVFPRPLILGPATTMSIDACIPLDILVLSGDVIVDVVAQTRVKYTLYGEPDQGLIARYVRLDACGPVGAKLKVSLRNMMGRTVIVRKIVFPAFMLDICYNEDRVDAGVLNVLITSVDTASVQPRRVERRECIPAPKLLRAPVFERQKFLMLYGL